MIARHHVAMPVSSGKRTISCHLVQIVHRIGSDRDIICPRFHVLRHVISKLVILTVHRCIARREAQSLSQLSSVVIGVIHIAPIRSGLVGATTRIVIRIDTGVERDVRMDESGKSEE